MLAENLMMTDAHQLKADLLDLMSSHARDEMARNAINDRRLLAALLHLLHDKNNRVALRAAWVLQGVTDIGHEAITPYYEQIINEMDTLVSSSSRRFVLRHFALKPLPNDEDLLGKLLHVSFLWLENPNEAIAARASAMAVIYKIGQQNPEIYPELKAVINNILPYVSKGLKNLSMRILTKIG